MPDSNVVLYGTTEGLGILNREDRKVASEIRTVAVSRFAKHMLELAKIPVAGVVYHGLDMKKRRVDGRLYRSIRTKTARNRSHVILTVSANHSRKGLGNLMRAQRVVEKQVPNAYLILHSQLNGYYDIDHETKALGIKNLWSTNLFGQLRQSQVNALYKSCNVYVQPSYSEGFGLPILEAFRFDKPVIAVNAPPFNEIIRHNHNGILVEPNGFSWVKDPTGIRFKMHTYSPGKLATAVIKCLTNPRLMKTLQEGVNASKETWNASNLYPQFLDYFA